MFHRICPGVAVKLYKACVMGGMCLIDDVKMILFRI